ncbi:hypothetical protein VC83_07817 [Pseudogymnoascus destructans]|uniref:Mid2 domain-containing protein n=2 Tax=Pseudogymnoascus destructans TaxID=655981 RepID=L8FNR2_PSED2|nr:uncharacterized protein VC83_07817 [Pseudogymnoascus destructans]ELR02184.1 hypothetical protein GMDG_00977 [Pseudogymnoascus destructans 20631-21]OAF55836.1 hypothetical protein VC83_07817 [Pseudogymnoascus destructans]
MSSARSSLSIAISPRAVVVLACLLSQVPGAQSTICYDTTGLPNTNYYPCEPDATISSCCAAGDVCYSNGLCSPSQARKDAHPKGTFITDFYRDSCSDPSFKDPKCLSQCFNESHQGITKCGQNRYCCYGLPGCNCNDARQVVTIVDGSVIATIDLGVSTSIAHTSSSTSTSKDPTATTTAPESSTPANTSQSQGSKSSAVPIGVGVGVGGAALIAVAAAAFFLRRRRRQKSPPLGPQPKSETKPDGLHPEMMISHTTAELPSPHGTPMYELPAPR